MKQQNKEIRAFGEIRLKPSEEETSSRHVCGYAAVYNRFSEDFGDWKEVIEPGAFDGVIDTSDVLAVINHDPTRGILARSRNGIGSLLLSLDETGLKYEFDAPATALGDELCEGLRRGDISQSSFAFVVSDERWEKTEEGTYVRHINKVERLFDVSPVYFPAYPDTSVAVRSLDAVKAQSTFGAEAKPPVTPSDDYYTALIERANR